MQLYLAQSSSACARELCDSNMTRIVAPLHWVYPSNPRGETRRAACAPVVVTRQHSLSLCDPSQSTELLAGIYPGLIAAQRVPVVWDADEVRVLSRV